MRVRSLPRLFPLALAVLLAGPPVAQATQAPVLTVHSIWGTREFASDGVRLLVFTNSARVWRQNTKGTYYVWDLQAKRLIPVSAQPGYQMFAKFSPDGRMVAFVRANNIYVTDLTTGAETAVTADGNEN